MIAKGLFLFASVALAGAASRTTVRDQPVFFLSAELTTNRSQVSAVAAQSTHGGHITLVNTQVWTARYDGPAHGRDQPMRLAIDGAGGVLVTGESEGPSTSTDFATLKYATDGTAIWTNRFASLTNGFWGDLARALALDREGNAFVSGTAGVFEWAADLVTLKYSSNGLPLWTNRFVVSPSNQFWVTDMAINSDGDGYLVAHDFGSDITDWVLKYDISGSELWRQPFSSSSLGAYSVSDMLIDNTGDLIVLGADGFYLSLRKYAPDGTLKSGFGSAFDTTPTFLLKDRADSFIVAADLWLFNTRPSHWYLIAKFANDGSLLWTNVFPTPNYQGGNLPHIATDPAGNVAATLGSPDSDPRDGDFTAVKISSAGVPLWTNRFKFRASDRAGFVRSAMDNAGNYYLLCYSSSPTDSNNVDFVTVKVAADGKPVWTNRFDGGNYDYASDMAIDADGSVLVTGMSGSGWTYSDFVTLKYSDYIVYNPPPGFVGTDAFDFTTVDEEGHSTTATVSIRVLPPPLRLSPIAIGPLGFQMQLEGTRITNATIILASSNLIHWTPIATNAPGTTELTDAAALSFRQRFYKAVTSGVESSPP